MERVREEYRWPRENGWEWHEVVYGVPEGYGASDSRGKCSRKVVSSKGD